MIRRYARVTERPDDFQVDLSADIFRGAVFLGLGRDHHGFRFRDESASGSHGALTGYTGAGNTPVDRWGRAIGVACLTYAPNDYVAGPTWGLLQQEVTFATWWRSAGNYTANQALMGNAASGSETSGVITFGYTDNKIEWWQNNGGKVLSSTASISTDAWRHVAVTRTKAGANYTVKLYLDGVLDNTWTGTTAPDATAGQQLCLGRFGAYAGYYLIGSLADSGVWSRALSPAEIAQLADPAWIVMMGGAIYTRSQRAVVGQVGAVTYTGSGSAVAGRATASASGLYSLVVYTGTGSVAAVKPVGSASATYSAPVYTASGSPSCTKVTASALATFTVPVYTGTGSPVVTKATASATGTTTVPIYVGTGAPAAVKATASASATYVGPIYTGSGSPSITKASASAAATYANVTYTGAGSPTVTKATGSASGTFVLVVPSGTIFPSVITKHGATTPTTADLADFQLGFDSAAGKLYIRSGASIVLIGPP
jgi:hypothetical protein